MSPAGGRRESSAAQSSRLLLVVDRLGTNLTPSAFIALEAVGYLAVPTKCPSASPSLVNLGDAKASR